MHNVLTSTQRILNLRRRTRTSRSSQARIRRVLSVLLASMLLGGAVSWAETGTAQPSAPATAPAPAEITEAIAQIDAAANDQQLDDVLKFYSSDFRNGDGGDYDSLRTALTEMWERFPDLNYTTTVDSWNQDGTAMVVETTTVLSGTEVLNQRPFRLNATLTARQRFENGKIVSQEILREESQLTSGNKPPVVEINIPEQVTVGQEFAFDAIVQEPLGDRFLLGAVFDEPVQPTVAEPQLINLELLSAGGLFKVGQAPDQPENRWISALLVRDDGISMITRRLRVVAPAE